MTDETSREFTTVGVIGLGTMGAGIAEVFARNGYQVIGVEVNETGVELVMETRGPEHAERLLELVRELGYTPDVLS